MAGQKQRPRRSSPLATGAVRRPGLREALWFVVGLALGPLFHFVEGNVHSSPDVVRSPPGESRLAQNHAWGDLEYTTIMLERPDESLPTQLPAPRPIRWFFEERSRSEIEALFESAGLEPSQEHLLLSQTTWQNDSNGWWVSPPREVVRDMSPTARRQIYAMLRQSPQNAAHCQPVRIPQEDFSEWLATSGLSPDHQEIFRRMTYRDAGDVCFSDCEAIEPDCSAEEKRHLAKTLSRVPALMIKLRVTPDSNTQELIRYWGRAGRGDTMKPLLDSLTHLREGGAINISFFFPELMRSKLYTYPRIQTEGHSPQEDCYWTAMNFLSAIADDRFFNGAHTWAVLQSEYDRVQDDWLFGDVLALVDLQGRARHLCVYVADDVVFTKNGLDPLQPWVLMRMRDMLDRYAFLNPLRMVVFRSRNVDSRQGEGMP